MSEEKMEDEMTPEERLAWLRERGVQIVSPGEQRSDTSASLSNKADATEIAYVYMPADSSKPLEERTVRIPVGYTGDYLVNFLQDSFKVGSDKVDISLLQKQARETLSASPDTPSTVSETTLQQVAQTASVETFTLVHPTPANQFTGVQIYLDEVGMLKRLPLNPRAAALAQRAGFDPAPQFFGDVFLARIQRKPVLRHVPFHLGIDTAPDAPWLVAATTQNLEYQTALNQATGRTHVTQAAVAGTDGQAKVEDGGFSWTQTEEEVELSFLLSTKATGKDVTVKFKPQQLQVRVMGKQLEEFRLFASVDVDGCTWTIDRAAGDTSMLVVTMEKADPSLWPRLID